MRIKEFDPEKVADSAMEVFWRKGFFATSIQDLVDETGLSRSSLYSTFKNKEELYQHALYRYQLKTQANIDLLSSTGSVKKIINQFFSQIIEDEITDIENRGCLIANASLELAGQDAKVAKTVTYNFERLKKALEKLIIRGQQSGEIKKDHSAHALALFFVNTIQGIRVLSQGCDTQNRQEYLSSIVETALNIL
ncbi:MULTISPECIES: TetR/AcrR family transcriptional regulator [unclassified Acinetobacter]|uniref:TetR/AcrR family transcriptional regulator n=1 Tax=unclassified Acinetobacter TaxID=196816 RepID=UPI0029350F32|nr:MULTISPECIES: TetR/AcrR family transcriptional regulator [unclassified Acinetobacter]WOE32319.1 TetR/AcrR family transcriptional regulator [Acinetobacter sp. SAAs470]WOE37792.1 TetR/AcrR family transcriptional regulator [Acinetobacter sp. SAAs474]